MIYRLGRYYELTDKFKIYLDKILRKINYAAHDYMLCGYLKIAQKNRFTKTRNTKLIKSYWHSVGRKSKCNHLESDNKLINPERVQLSLHADFKEK